jgi:hypothetical protein
MAEEIFRRHGKPLDICKIYKQNALRFLGLDVLFSFESIKLMITHLISFWLFYLDFLIQNSCQKVSSGRHLFFNFAHMVTCCIVYSQSLLYFFHRYVFLMVTGGLSSKQPVSPP